MRIFHEDDFEYRAKDHGPKYICETGDYRIGLVRFGPGHSHSKHVHHIMDEMFYVLEGKADLYVDDVKYTVEKGNIFHIAPGEVHYLCNPYDSPVKMVITSTKTEKPDKEEVE